MVLQFDERSRLVFALVCDALPWVARQGEQLVGRVGVEPHHHAEGLLFKVVTDILRFAIVDCTTLRENDYPIKHEEDFTAGLVDGSDDGEAPLRLELQLVDYLFRTLRVKTAGGLV